MRGEKVNYVWGKKWKVKKRETCTDRTPDISNKLVKDEWKEREKERSEDEESEKMKEGGLIEKKMEKDEKRNEKTRRME